MSDRDLLLNMFNGFGHEYDPIVVLVSQQSGITLYEAQYMLMIHEQRIEHLSAAGSVDISPSANFVNNSDGRGIQNNNRGGGQQSSGNNGGRGPNGRGKRGKGRWNNNNGNGGRIGHTATQCCNNYDRNSNPQPSQLGFTPTHGAMQVHTQPGHGPFTTDYVPNVPHTTCQISSI
ncbi:hypothetical protein ACOSP7_031918 [Xanthoceras sorbifolium]